MKPRKQKEPKFVQDLRRLVQESGKSPYAIARDTGGRVDRSQLYRFLSGQQGLSLETLGVIADQLGIRPTATA